MGNGFATHHFAIMLDNQVVPSGGAINLVLRRYCQKCHPQMPSGCVIRLSLRRYHQEVPRGSAIKLDHQEVLQFEQLDWVIKMCHQKDSSIWVIRLGYQIECLEGAIRLGDEQESSIWIISLDN
ncbi:hypothetical protein J6590_016479 [Homalodisca vitripennis]|nr:hypothetical protein J6590_016479 [Homalodisca vitripennis]